MKLYKEQQLKRQLNTSIVNRRESQFSLLFMLSMSMTMQAAVATPTVSALSQHATVVGKVFFDANLNGLLDEGERGIPGARLATVSGLLIETDGEGRYHLIDQDSSNALRLNGQHSYMMSAKQQIKLDLYSLPEGAFLTSENPRSLRVTSAGLNTVNFGVVFK